MAARVSESVRYWANEHFSRGNWRIVLFVYIVLAPVLLLFGYVRMVPIFESLILSFHKWDLINPIKPFIGWANYEELFQDENFWLSLKNTTIYAFSVVILSTLIAVPLAVFLAQKSRLSAIYQTIYFLPFITPMVPVSIAWKWIYDYNHGLLNYVLSVFGIPAVAWLTDPGIALYALIIMGVWKVVGYNMILLLVGIRNIPSTYVEAAAIDGASGFQRFRYVTLPLLRPILLYVFVTSSITAFNVFTQVYVMTLGSQSAPGQAVRVLVFDIYQNAFQYFRFGYASAEAVNLTLIVLGLTLIQFRIARNKEGMDG
ncbi:MAG: sugar ABC transporter permease [Rhodospirillaceae bacterium]|nr:sugar ABC transporter permease [Rhodospirillaceae bacterium]